jgi:tryptophan halogenase
MIAEIVVLGGGTAGLTMALTVKLRVPEVRVRVICSRDIGVIGVGEGTTVTFPQHFFEYLRLPPARFFQLAQPTWKLGVRFLWGSRHEFFYPFGQEYSTRWQGLSRLNASYVEPNELWLGPTTALMAHDRVFYRGEDGAPQWHKNFAFHVENKNLVAALETLARSAGVEICEGTFSRAERDGEELTCLHLENGEVLRADLYVDASGFASELLAKALGEPFVSFARTLLCDRAVIAGWRRTHEPIKPYTTAETMSAGWCWQIDHEHFINRGYVYSSAFVTDDAALAEFRAKNPQLQTEPRIVHFKTGRYQRGWVGNVVAAGNASGFVEPLEATAIQVITSQARTLADLLIDSRREITPSVRTLYNRHLGGHWDEIRDFLGVHYRFNHRVKSDFWAACHADADVGEAAGLVEYFRENGPSILATGTLVRAASPFGLEGYLALLVGQGVRQNRPWNAPATERQTWRHHLADCGRRATLAISVEEALRIVRQQIATSQKAGESS